MAKQKKTLKFYQHLREQENVLWFDEIGIGDVPLVGGKNASLGEMYTHLSSQGIRIPNGFAITAYAYFQLLEQTWAKKKIKESLKWVDTSDIDDLMRKGRKTRNVILWLNFPEHLEQEIIKAYHKLCSLYKTKELSVAVRSSATAEDLPDASFAGQQETYLNVRGEEELLEACKKCFASLFTNRAISYREDKWFDHFDVWLSIAVQKMVRSDKASSGVMFTLDTESGFEDVVLINSSYGLWENIVQGKVSPDEFFVRKTGLKKKKKSIISRKLWEKDIKMIYTEERITGAVKNVSVVQEEQKQFSLTDKEILELAKWGCVIEDHYNKPMDIERAKDGQSGKLFIVQARPETVHSQKNKNVLEEYVLQKTSSILTVGAAVWSKIGSGKANVIKNVHDISDFKKWEVLVTEMTDPDWEPIMKIASAIVTNSWWRTCHAAIISRELGIPCIVWTKNATQIIESWQKLTVSCSKWEEWKIYNGILPFKIEKTELTKLPEPKVKVMLNLWNPELAFKTSFIPNDGVGLAREEFIINSHIKIHPKALLEFDLLKDEKVKKTIENLTVGYANKKIFFVDKLAEGIATLAAAFYPKPVIVRLSDFKTNEYANLIWWKQFEPEEGNPMIGRRGASRYYDPKYEAAFGLECQAIKKVREEMWLDNVIVMVPFCRTVEEGKKVLETMKKYGLQRKKKKLQVYMMVEIPSNVILIDQFAKIFDGFSIGSNDLTQLTLWVDRDSALVAHVYDERNDAVKIMIKQVIKWARKRRKKIGICGQAPSDFPDFAEFLVKQKIDSISLNPDTVIKTRVFLGR